MPESLWAVMRLPSSACGAKNADAAAGSIQKVEQPPHRSGQGKKRSRSATIDKTVLALPAQRRIRDREHIKSVAKQPCLICGRRPADARHLRFAQSPALGRKVSDEFTVPLCRGHHRSIAAAMKPRGGIRPV